MAHQAESLTACCNLTTQTYQEMSDKAMKDIFFDIDHSGKVVVGLSIHTLSEVAMVDTLCSNHMNQCL